MCKPADPGRNAGHNAKRNACFAQGNGLFRTATENKRIADLQTQDTLALPCQFNKPLGNVALT